jgi:hypothetical protein
MNNMKKFMIKVIISFLINSIHYGIIQPSINLEDSMTKSVVEDEKIRVNTTKIFSYLGSLFIFVGIVFVIWYFFPEKTTEKKQKPKNFDNKKILNINKDETRKNQEEQENEKKQKNQKEQKNQQSEDELQLDKTKIIKDGFIYIFQELDNMNQKYKKSILYTDNKKFQIEIDTNHPLYSFNIFFDMKNYAYTKCVKYQITKDSQFLTIFYQEINNKNQYEYKDIDEKYMEESYQILNSAPEYCFQSNPKIRESINLINKNKFIKATEISGKTIKIFEIDPLKSDNPNQIINQLKLMLCGDTPK